MCFWGVGTKVASKIITKINKMFTIDFDYRVTIFWTVSWINGCNFGWVIISIWMTWCSIIKFSSQTNSQRNNFYFICFWRSFTLNTCVINLLLISTSIWIFSIETWWPCSTFNIDSINNSLVWAKFTFWIWICIY